MSTTTGTAIVAHATPWLYDQIAGITYVPHDTLIWPGETEPTVMTYVVNGADDALTELVTLLSLSAITYRPMDRTNAVAKHERMTRATTGHGYVTTDVRKARA
jgi:hypothetical protein